MKSLRQNSQGPASRILSKRPRLYTHLSPQGSGPQGFPFPFGCPVARSIRTVVLGRFGVRVGLETGVLNEIFFKKISFSTNYTQYK